MNYDRNSVWRIKKTILSSSFFVFCAFICIWCLFPFYWTLISSLREMGDIFSTSLIPSVMTFKNYIEICNDSTFGYSFINSAIVATCTSVISLVVSLLAAYPLARGKFKGRKVTLLAMLSCSTLPHVAVLSGMFELINIFNLYNTRTALIVSYMMICIPFTVWVLTSFLKTIPTELEEAAIMDGAGKLSILFKVFMPIMMPSMVTTGLLAFISAWNEFLFALTFTLTNRARTVPVSIALFSGATQHELPWGLIMAASVFVTLPLIILVIIFQKKIISGLMAGAVKG